MCNRDGCYKRLLTEREKVCARRLFWIEVLAKIGTMMRTFTMEITYNKLWHRLNERGLKKQDLREIAGISKASIAKLVKNENVTTDVLLRICGALNCDISDIMGIERPLQASNQPSNKEYSINSFFAGIGGFDIGFERCGFKTSFLCEINPFCLNVLEKHWPEVPKYNDITTLAASQIPDAEVWCGGFPCQDISVARGASKRMGLGGSRSGLFYDYAALIEEKKPEVVIIENVEGLFNSNGGRDFGVILQKLNELGYAVAWRLLNSRYFGVPQSRPRVYMCCWRNSPDKALRVMFDKEGAQKPSNGRLDFITESTKPTEYPKVPKVSYCLAATSGRHTGTDWSRTYVVCHDGVRRMTPKEYERLQGFPDLWTLPSGFDSESEDTDTLRYTAVGNAVSVPVIEWLANRVHQQLSTPSSKESSKDELHSYVPEFSKSSWSLFSLKDVDFTDENEKFSWPKAGIAWDFYYLGGSVQPTPREIIASSLREIVDRQETSRRYYLTPNAAEGILRRVDNQGRKLFEPLRNALEIEKSKKSK